MKTAKLITLRGKTNKQSSIKASRSREDFFFLYFQSLISELHIFCISNVRASNEVVKSD